MTVRKFYEEFKYIMTDEVLILLDGHNVYNDFLRDEKPLEFLMDCKIINAYISDAELVLEIEEVE